MTKVTTELPFGADELAVEMDGPDAKSGAYGDN